MSLTDTMVRGAIAEGKPKKVYDTDGLYLLVQPSGSKLWRFKYRFAGVEKGLSFGSYPEVKLAKARSLRDEARSLVAQGIDPSDQRRQTRVINGWTFELVGREYLHEQAKVLDQVTINNHLARLERFLFPHIGKCPVDQIEAPELLEALRAAQKSGVTDTVKKTKQLAGRIFRFAIATGRARRDPAADLKGALVIPEGGKLPGITDPRRIGELLRAIEGYQGQASTRLCLRLLPHVFLRSKEIRNLRWEWIDWDARLIRIPGPAMKMKLPHLVPLSDQTLALLREAHAVNGKSPLVFPGLVWGKSICEDVLNQALERLGFPNTEHVPHGFRTTFSTRANEHEWDSDMIELQLAHVDNSVRGDYNEAQKLSGRRAMMQKWSDYLDSLRAA